MNLEVEINRRGLWREYIEALGRLCGARGSPTTHPTVYGWHDVVRFLQATPEQRAQAARTVLDRPPTA